MITLAQWVSVFIQLCIILIVINSLMSWFPTGSIQGTGRRILTFVHETTDWYVRLFRRILPPVAGIDLSPILAIISLLIIRWLLVELILVFA